MIRGVCGSLFCVALLATISCQPVIFAQSDSPNGKYRCQVIRVRPAFSALFGNGEDWRYAFDLKDVSTGNSLHGRSFEFGDGKIKLDEKKLEFQWTDNQLVVFDHAYSPARRVLIASFDSAGQHWKQTN